MRIEITDNKIDIDCSEDQAAILGTLFIGVATISTGVKAGMEQSYMELLGKADSNNRVNIQIVKED